MVPRLEKLANELFLKYKTFNPFELSFNLNIRIKYMDLEGAILGQTSYPWGVPTIILDTSIKDKKEEFFICAHELCHIVEHDGLSSYYDANMYTHSKIEAEANAFAAIMIKKDYEYRNGEAVSTFSQLQNEYQVPSFYMEYYI